MTPPDALSGSSSTSPAPFIAVVGPTGSGKTALGVFLAQALGSEIISADSQLVYRGLNIGTAKPTVVEQGGIPHHLMDCADPDEVYTVAQYRQAASEVFQRLLPTGRPPIVVGGTGFYVKALLPEQEFPDIPPMPAFRERMAQLADEEGNLALHCLLAEKDSRRAADLHPNDRFRVIRALEVIEATGQPVPEAKAPSLDHVTWIGLSYRDRDVMRARIDARIEQMLADGWIEEVRELVSRYGAGAHALEVAHGYPELVQYLSGKRTLEDALAQIRINIHQYARRQLTWYRQKIFQQADRDPIRWFEVDTLPFTNLCESALKHAKMSCGS